MVQLNNPAARVQYWLEAGANKCAGTEAVYPKWCELWDLDASDRVDRAEVMERGAALIRAGAEARRIAEELAASDAMAELALDDWTKVEETLARFRSVGNANCQNFFQPLDDKAH